MAKKTKKKKKLTAPPPVPTKAYTASLHATAPLPAKFATEVQRLEGILGRPVWLLIQEGGEFIPFEMLDRWVANAFIRNKASLPTQPIALLLESPGGMAREAYRIAMVLRRRCGSFQVVVPRWAKSAATLLSLGADSIVLGEDGELGPLDVQVFDSDEMEDWTSGLDEVQAVEQLENSAVETAFAALAYMHARTGKTMNKLLPDVLSFVAETTKPLFDKIDAVKYTRMSRLMAVAEQYAVRLLQPRFNEDDARAIANDLVRRYPAHDFVIDREESARIGGFGKQDAIGLHVVPASDKIFRTHNLNECLGNLRSMMGKFTAIGRIQ